VIEAVGFDFDHTLGFDNRLERTVAMELAGTVAKRHRVAFEDLDGRGFDEAIRRYRNGESTLAEEVAGYFRRFVPAARLAPGECAELVDAFKAESTRRAPEFVRPAAGAAEMLAHVAALGLRSAILTNGWSPLQEEKARLVGFDGPVLASDTIGARKPTPAAFAALAEVLGCESDRIAYVGDDPRVDVAGAAGAGMIAVWVDSDGAPYPRGVAPPAGRITALAQLAPWLQGQPAYTANPPE